MIFCFPFPNHILYLELRLVIVVQVHGAVNKEDLIMMGEGNNDMEEQIHNKQSVLIC